MLFRRHHRHRHQQILSALAHITERLNHMATQADIDALAAQFTTAFDTIDTEVAELGTALTAINAEIAALGTANPALDLTALQAAADRGSASTQALQVAADAIEAVPPTEPPPAA